MHKEPPCAACQLCLYRQCEHPWRDTDGKVRKIVIPEEVGIYPAHHTWQFYSNRNCFIAIGAGPSPCARSYR